MTHQPTVTAELRKLLALLDVVEAARALDGAIAAETEASAGRGHAGHHDRELHYLSHAEPCTWHEDCGRCASAQYGTEAERQMLHDALREALDRTP